MQTVNDAVEVIHPRLFDKGYEFVVVYRHERFPELRFWEAYKSFYEYGRGSKYWRRNNYAINQTYIKG